MISGTEENSGYRRLEDQIAWYDERSNTSQRLYKRWKYLEIGLMGMVPIVAPFNGICAAILGGLSLTLEVIQQVNQWQHNWITYRSTCEALRHEKYTYIGRVGIYSGLADEQARKSLIERTEALISTEHAKWISRQEYSSLPASNAGQKSKR